MRHLSLILIVSVTVFILDNYKHRHFGWWPLDKLSLRLVVIPSKRSDLNLPTKRDLNLNEYYLGLVEDDTADGILGGVLVTLVIFVSYIEVYLPDNISIYT